MRLKELRQNKKLRQRDVAEFLNCSTPVYCRYETGEREPPFDIIKKLADYYGVTVDYLMGADTEQASGPADDEKAPADPRADKGAELFAKLNDENKAQVLQYMEFLMHQQPNEQK